MSLAGVLTLVFLALRGVPVVAVAAAAAAGGVASALGGAIAPALSAKAGGQCILRAHCRTRFEKRA